MKKYETHWDDEVYLPTSFYASDVYEEQPRFGFEISWNNPRERWKPYIVLHFYDIHYQIGWIVD